MYRFIVFTVWNAFGMSDIDVDGRDSQVTSM